MLDAALFLLLLGLVASVMLAIASKVFYVWEDPKVLEITDALPGANCGGCGYAGCSSAAEAIAANRAPCDVCVAGGFDTATAVAEIMGQTVEETEPELASSSGTYGLDEADLVFTYNGARDCRAAVMLYGGNKLCPLGCVGLGSCVEACRFGAVVLGENSLPVFNAERCVGCGACVEACPKGIITLTSATRRIVSEYTTNECIAPCQRACPTGIDIPAFIEAIRSGEYEEGLKIIQEKCPLPLVCGRICPAPCELECRRNFVDDAVAINPLKRFLADFEMQTGRRHAPYLCADSGHRTAVIGGGAEGLTAAYYLARLGHKPTIFEAKPDLGGILRYVISEDRLPRNVLDHEIDNILETGVEARTGQTIGRDFTVGSLLEAGFDTILYTTGGYDGRKVLHGERRFGTPVPGVHLLLECLADDARGGARTVSGHVVLVDAGKISIDVARRLREKGADRVTIVSNRDADELGLSARERKALRAEAIEVRGRTVVAAFGGVADRFSRVILETVPAAAGAAPQREMMEADAITLGAARLPELVISRVTKKDENGAGVTGGERFWQTVEVYRTLPDGGDNGVFTALEQGRVSDASAVVHSILSGRRAVRGIQQFFSGERISPAPNLVVSAERVLNVSAIEKVVPVERQRIDVSSAEAGTENNWGAAEEIPGLDEKAARKESERCLKCGLVCYEKAV